MGGQDAWYFFAVGPSINYKSDSPVTKEADITLFH